MISSSFDPQGRTDVGYVAMMVGGGVEKAKKTSCDRDRSGGRKKKINAGRRKSSFFFGELTSLVKSVKEKKKKSPGRWEWNLSKKMQNLRSWAIYNFIFQKFYNKNLDGCYFFFFFPDAAVMT